VKSDTNDVKGTTDEDEEPTQKELNRKRQIEVENQLAQVAMQTPINKPAKKVSDRELNSIKISKEYGQEAHQILDPNSTRKKKGIENEDDNTGMYHIDYIEYMFSNFYTSEILHCFLFNL
jgi:hypothetical protein